MPELSEKQKQEIINAAKNAKSEEKLLSMLSFALRARKLVCGADKVCDEIRRNGIPEFDENEHKYAHGIVILAADCSDNTKKRILNACSFYGVRCYRSRITQNRMSDRFGKLSLTSAVAVFDRDFTDGIIKLVGKHFATDKHTV